MVNKMSYQLWNSS